MGTPLEDFKQMKKETDEYLEEGVKANVDTPEAKAARSWLRGRSFTLGTVIRRLEMEIEDEHYASIYRYNEEERDS